MKQWGGEEPPLIHAHVRRHMHACIVIHLNNPVSMPICTLPTFIIIRDQEADLGGGVGGGGQELLEHDTHVDAVDSCYYCTLFMVYANLNVAEMALRCVSALLEKAGPASRRARSLEKQQQPTNPP